MPCKECAKDAEREARAAREIVANAGAAARRARESGVAPSGETAPKRESMEISPNIVRMKIGMMDSGRLGGFISDLERIGKHRVPELAALIAALKSLGERKGAAPKATKLDALPPSVRSLMERRQQQVRETAKKREEELPLDDTQQRLYDAVTSLPADVRREVMNRLDTFVKKPESGRPRSHRAS